jgi:ABC-type dipeptide/oligopeptide/nickel transport system permease subunit
MFWIAMVWIGLVVFAAIFAPVLPIQSDRRIISNLSPGTAPGWRAEFLGTDSVGRSVL